MGDGGLAFEICRADNEVVIAVSGEVDMATADQLAKQLASYADCDLVVDLADVRFLDSSGINALVCAYQAQRDVGRTLRTTHEQENVRMALRVTGVLDLFHGDRAGSD